MGDAKDSKKLQSDRAARKLKEQEQAKRSKPDTTAGKGAGTESVPSVTGTQDQVPRKNRSK